MIYFLFDFGFSRIGFFFYLMYIEFSFVLGFGIYYFFCMEIFFLKILYGFLLFRDYLVDFFGFYIVLLSKYCFEYFVLLVYFVIYFNF